MSNPTSAPFATITDSDKSATVTVVNCFLVVLSSLTVVTRALIRFNVSHLTAVDDWALNIALVFTIAQTVVTQLAVNHGLGKHQDNVSTQDFLSYSKDIYASEILTVVVMALTKFAVCYLIRTIRPKGLVRHLCLALDGVVALWAVSSILALIFQCHVPRPWLVTVARCVNLEALFYYVGIVNVVTDFALFSLAVVMVWDLQLRLDKKIWVWGLFAARILVPAAVIAQLVLLQSFFDNLDSDQTWNNAKPTLLNQVAVNLSVITGCIPSLRRVVTDLASHQTGLEVTKDMELTIGGSHVSSRADNLKNNSSTLSKSKNGPAAGSAGMRGGIPYGHNVDGRLGNNISIYSSRDKGNSMARHSSEEHLRNNDIQYTVEIDVHDEDDEISAPGRKR